MPTPSSLPAVDPARCPLCGGPNGCAMEAQRASGQPQPPCWCTRVTFSSALIARLPEAARGQACICATCVAADASSLAPPPT